jgi:hypothetical protein
MQADVEVVLAGLLAAQEPITSDAVKARVATSLRPTVPEMVAPEIDLGAYDTLLGQVGT